MKNEKHSVLIIDDMESGVTMLEEILSSDYVIYSALSGMDGIAVANETIPDIILLDIMMPGMNGYKVIAELKKSDKTKDIPVVFVTSLISREEEEKGLMLGAADYIFKPFSPAIVKLRLGIHMKQLLQLRTIQQQMEDIKSLEWINLKKMFDVVPHGCHVWDRNFEIVDSNDASLELLKAKDKDELAKNYFDYSPELQPDGEPSIQKAANYIKRAFAGEECEYSWIHVTSEGNYIPCEIKLCRIALQSADFVVSFIKDMREHTEMLREINRQEKLLYTLGNMAGILLHSTIDEFVGNMYDCMGMVARAVEADRVYIWKNHEKNGELFCTQIYEWSEGAEPVQDTAIAIDISYRETVPEWEEILGSDNCINNVVGEMSANSQAQLSPQGILSIFVAPIFLNKTFWGFIGFDDCHQERLFSKEEELILRAAGLLIANSMLKNDMTEELQLTTEKLKEALEEAKAMNRAKSQFLSNMSHEIRTPMNAIIGMGELLEHEMLTSKQRSYVSDIVTSANSLLRIINDILDFSKIESGNYKLDPVDYDFDALLNNIDTIFSHAARKKGLEYKSIRGHGLPLYLYGDDIRLRQTLLNVIGNAVKFTEKGSVTLRTSVSGDSLVFHIIDTGIGIHKEDIDVLFNSFSQLDRTKNRNVVGTGLGLAICESFISMMNGKIKVDSRHGKGTIFTITIPMVIGNKNKITNTQTDKSYEAIYAPEAQVLVVDDNAFNIRVAKGLLNLQGIEAEAVSSGFVAIDELKVKDFDLVFMDHMMPDMDGVETMKRIRQMGPKYKDLPIVALTANAIAGVKESFLEAGFDDFITKPIDTKELVNVLTKWLPAEKVGKPNKQQLPDLTEEDEAIREENVAFLTMLGEIEEINTQIGLSLAMSNVSIYRDTIIYFFHRVKAECIKMTEALRAKNISAFRIEIHSMKSALSTIGAVALSETAAALEKAAKDEDIEHCLLYYPPLEVKLHHLRDQLATISATGETPKEKASGDREKLLEVTKAALAAAEDADSDVGLELLEELLDLNFDEQENEMIKLAYDAFDDFECDSAAKMLREILERSEAI
ncbi:MAG: response regulator [Lachnospiraceae bacterium]|jgi:signal transduction histidine kinase/DNA-binding response OmpR family regulator|nr:response regulator [Lachnospiraceae bacterium]